VGITLRMLAYSCADGDLRKNHVSKPDYPPVRSRIWIDFIPKICC
jgi:hypothetical protein